LTAFLVLRIVRFTEFEGGRSAALSGLKEGKLKLKVVELGDRMPIQRVRADGLFGVRSRPSNARSSGKSDSDLPST
jgi:hypothetical protein